MDYETIILEKADGIATLTLNRPEKLNALTLAMWTRLGEVMRALSDDATVRCVVLRGAGDKAFAAGADISEFERVRANDWAGAEERLAKLPRASAASRTRR